MTTGPTAELDGRFSSEDANATPWADVATAPSRTRNGLGGIRFNCWK